MSGFAAVLIAVATAAGVAVFQALVARSRLAVSPQTAAAERRDEIAELEDRLARCQDRYGQLWSDLAKCEDRCRDLEEKNYTLDKRHRIVERHLTAAHEMLRDLGVQDEHLP